MKIELNVQDLGGAEAAGLVSLLMQTHGTHPEMQAIALNLANGVIQAAHAQQPDGYVLTDEQLAAALEVQPKEAGVPFDPAASVTEPASVPAPAAPAAPATVPAPPTPAPTTVGAQQTDSAGLPWDARIHAGTKTTKADGTWKRKPGIDDATVASVEAELKAVVPLAAVSATPPPPPAPAPVAAPPAPPAPPAASAPPAPAAPPVPPVSSPAPSAPPPPAPTAAPVENAAPAAPDAPAKAPDAVRFAAAVQATTAAQAEGKLTPADALAAVQHYVPGATSVADLLAGEATTPGAIDGYAAWIAAL